MRQMLKNIHYPSINNSREMTILVSASVVFLNTDTTELLSPLLPKRLELIKQAFIIISDQKITFIRKYWSLLLTCL